ncbi:hypothetical protein F385_3097 [Pantoea agglomerans 299R]|jgi:hypothetical protein|nr:hypothetical protein F385_3097 [Pantoea agglomerans 299R]
MPERKFARLTLAGSVPGQFTLPETVFADLANYLPAHQCGAVAA